MKNLQTAIRIILYFGLTAMLLSQPLTLVTVLLAVFTTVMTIVIAMIDYKSQLSMSERPNDEDDMMAKGTALDAIGELYGMKRKTFSIMGIGYKESDEAYRARLKEKLMGRP